MPDAANMGEENKYKYTCLDYRQEMTLLALRMRLSRDFVSDEEKQNILKEIREIESAMQMN
ncbi:MAG: hypothetical protein QG578_1580 [Thermodesulfobacteriota bacterium]|nr:hypothetical protein [Thermodesulfobacteriota bacterium]